MLDPARHRADPHQGVGNHHPAGGGQEIRIKRNFPGQSLPVPDQWRVLRSPLQHRKEPPDNGGDDPDEDRDCKRP